MCGMTYKSKTISINNFSRSISQLDLDLVIFPPAKCAQNTFHFVLISTIYYIHCKIFRYTMLIDVQDLLYEMKFIDYVDDSCAFQIKYIENFLFCLFF